MKKIFLLVVVAMLSFGVSAQQYPVLKKTIKSRPHLKMGEEESFYMPDLITVNSGEIGYLQVGGALFPDSLASVWALQQYIAHIEGTDTTFRDTLVKISPKINPYFTSVVLTFDPYSTVFGNGLAGLIDESKGYSIDSISVGLWYNRYYQGEDADDVVDTLRITLEAYQGYNIVDGDGKKVAAEEFNWVLEDYPLQGLRYNCMMMNTNTQPEGIGSSLMFNPTDNNKKYTYDIYLEKGDTVVDFENLQWVNIGPYVEIGKSLIANQPGYVTVLKMDYMPGHPYKDSTLFSFDWRENDRSENFGEVDRPYVNANRLSLGVAYTEDEENDNPAEGFYDPYGFNAASNVSLSARHHLYGAQHTTYFISMPLINQMPAVQFYYTENANGDGSYIDHSTDAINETAALINSIYPNPAKDMVTVTLANEGEAQIDIVNTLGQTVKSVAATRATNTISTADLKAGLYIVRVMQGNNVSTAKLSIR